MTSGIKIPIGGDFTGLNQAMGEFQQNAKRVFGSLNGGAKIDTSDAKKSLAELENSVKKVQEALSKATTTDISGKTLDSLSAGLESAAGNANSLQQAMGNAGTKGSESFKKTVGDTRKLIAELEKAKRLQAVLARQGHTLSAYQAGELEKDFQYMRKSATGAQRKKLDKFGSLSTLSSNWRDLASNEVGARRQYNEILRHLGVAGPGAAPNAPAQRTFAQFMGQQAQRATGAAFRAATPGTGVGGSIAGSAVQEAAGSAGGMMSMGGLGRIAGGVGIGMLAYGAIRAVTAVASKISSSEGESTGYSDLLRQMGDTSSTFEGLRESIRSAGKGLDMSFGDSAKMASSYVRGVGIDGMGAAQLHAELKGAGGFGRAMGLAPEAGSSMFATLRHSKVSSGDADNKRFAFMIGEAVARAGVFTKADEVLSAVASYTEHATRSSLTPASTGSYIGAMSNLMNGNRAGMDPQGVAAMLDTADAGFRNPQGEAQRNFLLGALQKSMPGMNALDMGFMQDAGMFAKAKDVFKEGNPAFDSADDATKARYRTMAKQGGNSTFFDMAMSQFNGMSSDEQRANMKGLMPGMSDSMAARLQEVTKLNGGKLSNTFGMLEAKYGVDPSKMSGTAVRNILDVEYGDQSKLKDKAKWMRSQNLSESERAELDRVTAKPGEGNEDLKQVLVKLGSTRNMEMTEGDVSRKNMASLENMASDMATKLIPMTNAIREAITALATFLTAGTFKDRFGASEKAQGTLNESLATAKTGEGRRNAISAVRAQVEARPNDYTPEFRKKLGDMYQEAANDAPPPIDNGGELPSGKSTPTGKKLKQQADMINTPTRYDDLFKSAAENHGVDWRDLKQIAVQESGLTPWAQNLNSNGTIDQGMMQLNNRYHTERGITPTNVNDPATNINAGAQVFAQALKKSKGDVREAFRRYNGAGPNAERYADNAMRLRSAARSSATAATSAAKAAAQSNVAKAAIKPGAAKAAAQDIEGPASLEAPYGVGDVMREIGAKLRGDITFGETPLPAGDSTRQQSQTQQQMIRFAGEFNLNDRATGRPMADPIQVAGITAPRAAGMRGVA